MSQERSEYEFRRRASCGRDQVEPQNDPMSQEAGFRFPKNPAASSANWKVIQNSQSTDSPERSIGFSESRGKTVFLNSALGPWLDDFLARELFQNRSVMSPSCDHCVAAPNPSHGRAAPNAWRSRDLHMAEPRPKCRRAANDVWPGRERRLAKPRPMSGGATTMRGCRNTCQNQSRRLADRLASHLNPSSDTEPGIRRSVAGVFRQPHEGVVRLSANLRFLTVAAPHKASDLI